VACVDVVKNTRNSVTDPHYSWIVHHQASGEPGACVEFNDREDLRLIGLEGRLPDGGHAVNDALSGDIVPAHVWAEAARAV
jgi:hypothetical protein